MLTLVDKKSGSMRSVERAAAEQGGVLTAAERYVADCLQVADVYSAGILIRRGEASGWRLWLTSDGLVELWAPVSGLEKATSYTMRNEVMRRALLAHGAKPLPTLRHQITSLAAQRLGLTGL